MPPLEDFLKLLAAGVVLVTTVTVIAFIFFVKQRDRMQYRFVLALLFFSVTAATSLLFAGNAEIKSDVKVLSVTVTGVAAMWLAAIYFFSRWFPESDLFPAPVEDWTTAVGFARLLRNFEAQLDWTPYAQWLKQVAVFKTLFVGGEEGNTLKYLLEAACNAHERRKLYKARVTTVFFYFRDKEGLGGYIVKLQRIRGEIQDGEAYIRFNSNASFVGHIAASVILVKTEADFEMFTDRDRVGSNLEGFHRVTGKSADCLIVSAYDDYPQKDDYLLVDVERFSHENQCDITIGVASPGREIINDAVWLMRRPLATPPREVPLVFRSAAAKHSLHSATFAPELKDWLERLDKILESAPPTMDAAANVRDSDSCLRRIHAELQKRWPHAEAPKFQDIFRFSGDKDDRVYEVPNGHDVVLMLAQWS